MEVFVKKQNMSIQTRTAQLRPWSASLHAVPPQPITFILVFWQAL